jgi:hypothetical protein
VSATAQLEEVTQLHAAPRLLVEWSSPWDEFVTSIRPALSRSAARLAGEAPFGLIPYRIALAAFALELFLIFCAIIVPIKLAQLHPYIAPRLTGHDIIYYSGDELPRTEDLGGTHAGAAGRAGGTEAHHRTQTIKVARGGSLVEKVLDAPKLKLQPSPGAVANLLAIRPDAGPPPTEGLRSDRAVPKLPSSVIAPVPALTSDVARSVMSLGGVIPPAPSVSRDRVLIAPVLNSGVVAPAPTVSSDRTRSLPAVTANVIPPAPDVARDRALVAPSLDARIVAPAPSLSRDASQSRPVPALNSSIVPPAPAAVSRDISRSPVQMTNAAVVPPPVSAPEREGSRNPKLFMPAPSVIAPPPSTDMAADLHRLASGSVPDVSKTVVPPPPTPAASTSFMGSLLDRVFGSTAVVAPPPTVTGSSPSRTAGGSLAANVVPPPPAVPSSAPPTSGARAGASRVAPSTTVVPPPPSVAGSGASGGRSSVAAPTAASVVPPPPSVSGAGGARNNQMSSVGSSALAPSVVPPPPTLAKGDGLASGRGASGAGLGAPMDAGSVVAPPRNAGSGSDSGVVVSKDPGPKVGLPANARPGSLAMSPAGGDKPGLGGTGGGSGMVRGEGAGSALTGAGTGGGKTGTGHGSDPAAKAGISPTPGPGGAGSATRGSPAVPGVSVAGGSSIVTVDFGSNIGSGDPKTPGRSSVKDQRSLGVSVQSTASSGGAFGFYHLLAGATHDIYIDTAPLPAVMTYSEPALLHASSGRIADPEAIHTDLPAGLPHVRLVVTCVLDASGNLKSLHVLEAGPADMTAKVMAALPGWKFSPVMIGNQPVEVNAILGFNIDTNDRR